MMEVLRIRDLDPLFFTITYSTNHFTYAAILAGDLYVSVVMILLVMIVIVMWFISEV